jgi:hypothetical protein
MQLRAITDSWCVVFGIFKEEIGEQVDDEQLGLDRTLAVSINAGRTSERAYRGEVKRHHRTCSHVTHTSTSVEQRAVHG